MDVCCVEFFGLREVVLMKKGSVDLCWVFFFYQCLICLEDEVFVGDVEGVWFVDEVGVVVEVDVVDEVFFVGDVLVLNCDFLIGLGVVDVQVEFDVFVEVEFF